MRSIIFIGTVRELREYLTSWKRPSKAKSIIKAG